MTPFLFNAGQNSAAAAGADANVVWVCGGITSTTLKSACQTYNLGSGAVASAATLNTARSAGSGGSNNTSKGVISHGYNIGTGTGYTNTTETITFPSGTWANSATVANNGGRMGGGCSTGTHLFSALSDNPLDNNTTNKTEKYNFSADTTAAGGTLASSYFGRSGSHGTAAISVTFGGSPTVNTVNKYTHSSDTAAAAGALSASVQRGSCAGDSTYAHVGNNATSNFTGTLKYNMSAETSAAGGTLSQSTGYGYGCGSNTTKQLWAGGNSTGTQTVVYTFSGDTTANGTAITDVNLSPVVFCEKPGGLN